MELESCVDYCMLQAELTNEQLNTIDKVIKHYISHMEKYDDGEIDIIGDYSMQYGNGYVIDWYEGIMSTEEFIDIIKNGYEISDSFEERI